MKILLMVLALMLSGCAVSGQIKDDGTVILRGWGAQKVSFPCGTTIEKQEPLHVPDSILTTK